MVLQLGQVYPAVRHAIIAISVIEEPFIRPMVSSALTGSRQNLRSTAVEHFNNAIQSFLQNSNSFTIEAQITCCILFHTLTTKLEKTPAGAAHIRAANIFLREHQARVVSGEILFNPVVAYDLDVILQKYTVGLSTFRYGFRHSHSCEPYEHNQHMLSRVPSVAINLGAMHESLTLLLEYAIAYHLQAYSSSKIHSSLHSSFGMFQDRLDHFQAEFELGVMNHSDTISPHYYKAYLQIHLHAAQIFAGTLSGKEWQYDAFSELFTSIVDLSDLLLQAPDRYVRYMPLGIISPLFLVATKCRFAPLRSRALKLLHSSSRVEHVWSSCIASTVAGHIIHQEEMMNSQTSKLFQAEGIRFTPTSFRLHATQNSATLVFEAYSSSGQFLRTQHAQLLCKPLAWPDGAVSGAKIPDHVIQASGYGGTTRFAPKIACHCVSSNIAAFSD